MANFKCVRFKEHKKGSMLGFADLGVLDAMGNVICVVQGFKLMKGQDGEWLGTPDKERMAADSTGKKVGNGVYDKTFYFGASNDEERSKALAAEALRVVMAKAMSAE